MSLSCSKKETHFGIHVHVQACFSKFFGRHSMEVRFSVWAWQSPGHLTTEEWIVNGQVHRGNILVCPINLERAHSAGLLAQIDMHSPAPSQKDAKIQSCLFWHINPISSWIQVTCFQCSRAEDCVGTSNLKMWLRTVHWWTSYYMKFKIWTLSSCPMNPNTYVLNRYPRHILWYACTCTLINRL